MIKVNRKLLYNLSRGDELLSSCENMLVISSTFLPLGQPDNTELSGNECCCKNEMVEFAISFQFSVIGQLKMELLFPEYTGEKMGAGETECLHS